MRTTIEDNQKIDDDTVKQWQSIIDSMLDNPTYTHNQLMNMVRYAHYQSLSHSATQPTDSKVHSDEDLPRILNYGIKVIYGIYREVPDANVLIAPGPTFIGIREDKSICCETSTYKVAECAADISNREFVIDRTVEFVRMKMRNFNTVAIYVAYNELVPFGVDRVQFTIRVQFMDPKDTPVNMYVLNEKDGSYEVEVIDLTVDQVVTTHDKEGNKYHINKKTGQVVNAFTYQELQGKVAELQKQVSALNKSISNITEVVGL